jgi:hypothetical protein
MPPSERTHRPLERFWPYKELAEDPTPEELAALDPGLHTALFGARDLPFSVTVVFGPFDGPRYAAAVELARTSAGYREAGHGDDRRHRARFLSSEAGRLHDLWAEVGQAPGVEVLIDDRPVPYARERRSLPADPSGRRRFRTRPPGPLRATGSRCPDRRVVHEDVAAPSRSMNP